MAKFLGDILRPVRFPKPQCFLLHSQPNYIKVHGVVIAIHFSAQVKLKLSHHSLTDNSVSCNKPLVFVMDPSKDPDAEGKKRKKKKKADGPTAKNFGSKLCTEKVKSSNRIVVGWRLRFPVKNNRSKGYCVFLAVSCDMV